MFYPKPNAGIAYWIGIGIIAYGVVVALCGSLWAVRLFRRAATLPE
jgi:hypothetical protein